MKNEKILVIEDDPTILALISASLCELKIETASSLSQARQELISNTSFGAILLDLELPDGNGLHFLHELQSNPHTASIPCLVLSGHSQLTNKVTAFGEGADDFICKPFDLLELKARVFAKIKKAQKSSNESQLLVGDLIIDFDKHKVFINSSKNNMRDLGLTFIEFKLLTTLAKNLGRTYSREYLLDTIWKGTYVSDRTIDSHIAHLRKKIRGSKAQIEAQKSVGYSLNVYEGNLIDQRDYARSMYTALI